MAEASAGPTARTLDGPDPVEGDSGLENGGVGAFPDTMANGNSCVVEPRPTADGEQRGKAKGVHDGGVTVVKTRCVDGVELPGGAVVVLLAGGGEVDVR